MSRIEELERRVRQDPSSITFGALAEEYRRAGRFEDAVATCRAGLERHPAYLSARVTLGRALQELQQLAEARVEFEYVLSLAPDNLAALRGLADLQGESAAPQPADDPVAFAPPSPLPPPLPPESSEVPTSMEAADVEIPAGDPDFSALDASIESAGSSQRAAQIERLEIWLARLEELRRDAGFTRRA